MLHKEKMAKANCLENCIEISAACLSLTCRLCSPPLWPKSILQAMNSRYFLRSPFCPSPLEFEYIFAASILLASKVLFCGVSFN